MAEKGRTADSFERVLVMLEAGIKDRLVLEAAAQMAALGRSELFCLFVEDINLLNIAALPFTREASFGSWRLVPLETSAVEAEFQRTARAMRQEMASLAQKFSIPCRFEVVRGDFAKELKSVVRQKDLVVFTQWRRSREAMFFPETGVPAMAQASCAATLLLRPMAKLPHGPVVILAGPEGVSAACFTRALSMAALWHERLYIFPLVSGPVQMQAIEEFVKAAAGAEPPILMKGFSDCDDPAVLGALHDIRPGLIMLVGYGPPEAYRKCIDLIGPHVSAPILVMRGQ